LRTTALLVLALVPAAVPGGEVALKVRASSVAAPCTEAAGIAWQAGTGRRVEVSSGSLRESGDWDVLVGASVELTRALEGRDAVSDSDVEIATIPWVLHVPTGGSVRSLDDLARSGVEAVVLGGDAAYEARRALAEHNVGRVRESTDVRRLRSAAVALVPLSLAGPGPRTSVDVPPVRVGAAVGARATRTDDATAFVRYLGSEAGQQVFATCAPPQ
jgi:accessory colonization factor AcfC